MIIIRITAMAFKTVGDHGRLLYNTTQEVMPMFYKADTVPSRVMRKFVCKLWLNEVSQQ